jgi:hypothetical protein
VWERASTKKGLSPQSRIHKREQTKEAKERERGRATFTKGNICTSRSISQKVCEPFEIQREITENGERSAEKKRIEVVIFDKTSEVPKKMVGRDEVSSRL